jgi:hypothetical protein
MKTVILILILFGNCLYSQERDSTKVKVAFLTQDVADGYDHAGCTPKMLDSLEQYFKDHYKPNYIPYDISKLMENDVEPYYIFNKIYCEPIGKVLGANTFVMTRLELINRGEKLCSEDIYRVFLKVYSSLSNKSEVIYENDKIKSDSLKTIFRNNEEAIIDKIFLVAKSN